MKYHFLFSLRQNVMILIFNFYNAILNIISANEQYLVLLHQLLLIFYLYNSSYSLIQCKNFHNKSDHYDYICKHSFNEGKQNEIFTSLLKRVNSKCLLMSSQAKLLIFYEHIIYFCFHECFCIIKIHQSFISVNHWR